MINNKLKTTPRKRLQKWADEALFVRSFHYTSDLSPEEVRQQLNDLTYQPGKLAGVFFPRRRVVTIETVDDDHFIVKIKSKLGGLYTSLNTQGHIVRDQATGKTHISGEVKFDAVYLTVLLVGLFFLITWAMASLSRFGVLPSPFILFTLGLTNLFYFRQLFVDRNQLLQTLDDTLTTSDISAARQRLTDDLSATDETDLHYSQQESSSHEATS